MYHMQGESEEEDRLLTEEVMSHLEGACWHPNGDWIIYAGAEQGAPLDGATQSINVNLWAVDRRTHDKLQLTTASSYEGYPQVSLDGKSVYFVSNARAEPGQADAEQWQIFRRKLPEEIWKDE
jgi:Tol biopolymer transport system component